MTPRAFGPPMLRLSPGTALRAGLGAALGLLATGVALWLNAGQGALMDHPMIIAPFAASAVLIFAVPSSPFAQPWSVVVGNAIATLCGLIVHLLIPHPLPAMAVAVGVTILLTAAARALHPPAGALAAYVVLAQIPGAAPDWGFLVTPTLSGSVLLVITGLIWHRLIGTDYPHLYHP